MISKSNMNIMIMFCKEKKNLDQNTQMKLNTTAYEFARCCYGSFGT